MADFFELQNRARTKTRSLVVYFIIAVVLIIITVNLAVWFAAISGGVVMMPLTEWPYHHYSWLTSIIVVAIILITSSIQSARLGGGGVAVAKMVGARRVLQGSKDKHERRLLNITEEMSIASGMPMPKVYIMDDETGINAFVAGLKPSETVLVVTHGTLTKLTRDELQGVVGHEFSHIFNSDMTINVRLMGILAGILVIGQLGYILMRIMGHSHRGARFSSRRSGNSNSSAKIIFLIAVLGVALFAIGYIGLFFGRLIKASISRQREFLADASSVQFTRNADGIANALAHIQLDSSGGFLQNSHAEDMSHMCFDMPVKMSFKGWLATHPPLQERIIAINPNFSFADYRPQPSSGSSAKNRTRSATSAHPQYSSSFAENTAQADATFQTEIPVENGSASFIDSIGKPSVTTLKIASSILSQVPDEILQQSIEHRDNAQLVVFALLVQAEPEDKQQIDALLERHLPAASFKLFLKWEQQILQLNGWVRLPLLNHVIPVLQQCNKLEIDSLFVVLLNIIKNNKHISLSEYILFALLKLRLQPPTKKNNIPSLVEIKSELSIIFSLVNQAAFNETIMAEEQYQVVMKGLAIGIIPEFSQQRFNAVNTHQAFLKLSRLSPFLKKTVITAIADCIIHDGKINFEEYELLRAICDYLDCPLPPLDWNR